MSDEKDGLLVTIKYMKLASIRRYLDRSLPPAFYMDVMEKVLLPSSQGDNKDYDAIIIADGKQQREIIERLMEPMGVSIKVFTL